MNTNLKNEIKVALENFTSQNLSDAAIGLFECLGYKEGIRAPLIKKHLADFIETFEKVEGSFSESNSLAKDWEYVDFLFQLTENEISIEAGGEQKTKDGYVRIADSFVFLTIKLKEDDYSRKQLAQITREVNKLFPMPAVLLFRYGNKLSIAVIDRRVNLKDEDQDVLRKVTLIKDISINSPHRADIEILNDLSYDSLSEPKTFNDLFDAWQKKLDLERLNTNFYNKLFNWYSNALTHVIFPGEPKGEKDKEEYRSHSLIRLLTRLLFVWFIKEKGLVPPELFDPKELEKKYIKGLFQDETITKEDNNFIESSFYKGILQNLFFAVLNCPIEAKKEDPRARSFSDSELALNQMKYKDYFHKPQNFLNLVNNNVPFLNGGLFDCLDVLEKGSIKYIDGFTQNLPTDQLLKVPNKLFFAEETSFEPMGLINILNSFKFTITENTPIEESVALDPELLGRVFENLLASINPETGETARKESGSFYTPRKIVNYMVDESLSLYLSPKLVKEANMVEEEAEKQISLLLSYNGQSSKLNEKQIQVILKNIDECRILDPSCGSGAFPMGILQKLVLILKKLDPDNSRWYNLQKIKASQSSAQVFEVKDKSTRKKRLEDINNVFELNSSDYGRKLYLIENCIHGSDIQSIAAQISKLRFFISLIVDQKIITNSNNFGVRPLPNLETKIVTADTLISLPESNQIGTDDTEKINSIKLDLIELRKEYTVTNDSILKQEIRKKDSLKRSQLYKEMEKNGWHNRVTNKIASYAPYNQLETADWFESEWMFGIEGGFDIVIGNPPYTTKISKPEYFLKSEALRKNKLAGENNQKNLFALFVEKSINLVKPNGIVNLIIPHSFSRSKGYNYIRRFVDDNCHLIKIKNEGSPFQKVTLEMVSFSCRKHQVNGKSNNNLEISDRRPPQGKNIEFTTKSFGIENSENSFTNLERNKLGYYPIYFNDIYKQILSFPRGSISGRRGFSKSKAEISGSGQEFVFIGAKDIKKWEIQPEKFIKIIANKDIILNEKKVIIPQFGASLRAAILDPSKFIPNHGVVIISSDPEKFYQEFILGLLNSKLVRYILHKLILNDANLTVHLDGIYLEKIPVPEVSLSDQGPIIKIVKDILKSTNPPYHLENELNRFIYKIYGLSDQQIAKVEGYHRNIT